MIPCSARETLPDVTFTLGGLDFAVKPKDYLYDRGGGDPDREMCMSALMGMDLREGGPRVELGYAFLREWYSVFDLGRRTISFARSKPL